MKKTFTFLAVLLCTTLSQAQIKHISYGVGWSIPINANMAFDINEDGRTDFHINRHLDELGFSPEFIVGCIASPSDSAYVGFGAREMSIFEYGDEIDGTDLGFLNFIDDDRGSNWHRDQGFAEGWNDGEVKYVGFILLAEGNGEIMASNGWMKIKVDAQNEALVLLALAYEESLNVPIIAGAITTSTEDVLEVESFTLAPNPVSELLSISFDYKGTQTLSAAVYNELGQKMIDLNRLDNKGNTAIQLDVKGLNNGSYYVQLTDGKAMRTERFTVIK